MEQHKDVSSGTAIEKPPAAPGAKPSSPRRGTALVAAAAASIADPKGALSPLEEALGLFETAAEVAKEVCTRLFVSLLGKAVELTVSILARIYII